MSLTNPIIRLFLNFTGRQYSTLYKMISMGPGILIFLIISPLIIYQLSSLLSALIGYRTPRSVDLLATSLALTIAIPLMSWALFELWTKGEGTPAPITPTNRLVTTGPYRLCRNPIELGTNIYFFALGAFFDTLITGLFCLFFGLLLGTAYIKLIEEREMRLRFGDHYLQYLRSTPFMSLMPPKNSKI